MLDISQEGRNKMTTITTTYEATAGDFVEKALEATVEFVWATMWKPWNALLETKFAFIGYLGYISIALVGFTASLVYYAYTKVKALVIR